MGDNQDGMGDNQDGNENNNGGNNNYWNQDGDNNNNWNQDGDNNNNGDNQDGMGDDNNNGDNEDGMGDGDDNNNGDNEDGMGDGDGDNEDGMGDDNDNDGMDRRARRDSTLFEHHRPRYVSCNDMEYYKLRLSSTRRPRIHVLDQNPSDAEELSGWQTFVENKPAFGTFVTALVLLTVVGTFLGVQRYRRHKSYPAGWKKLKTRLNKYGGMATDDPFDGNDDPFDGNDHT